MDFSPDDAGTVQHISTVDPQTRRPLSFGKHLTGMALAAAHADGTLLFTFHQTTCSDRRAKTRRTTA